MLRESLYFHFAGRRSTDFGIYNVSISDGLFDEQVTEGRSINEVSIRGRTEPYFIDTSEEPKTLQLRFAFLEKYNDKLIDDVIRWLNVSYYEPLYFSEDVDRVFYAMPIDGIRAIHNGLKEGYLELTMRCNSSRSYSHEVVTPFYKPEGNSKFQTIEIINRGHYSIYPDIWIEKDKSPGDILIYNLTNKNEEFKLVNIKGKERLHIDCLNEIITTSIPNIYRYDDFNDNYLKLVYGVNRLKISNNATYKFRYRLEFS